MQGVLVNFVLKYIDQVETYEGVGTKIILQQKYWDPFKICLSLYFYNSEIMCLEWMHKQVIK